MKASRSSLLILSLAFFLDGYVGAVRVSVSGHRRPVGAGAGRREERLVGGFGKRASISGQAGLEDTSDLDYYTNITLGGEGFQVLVDTGSSDLWVAGNVPNSQDTGKSASVQYAIGAVQGPIQSATLEFDEFTVDGQVFISAAADNGHPAGQGLIGLGPNSGSNVHSIINNPSGDAVLDRIFRQDTSTPNYFTFLLGRSSDPTEPFPGDITVGAPLEAYGNITAQPKLQVWQVEESGGSALGQHWQTLLDKDGLVGPDGQPVSVQSGVKGAPKGQLNVVLDSGFSLPQVPKSVADAIYDRVPGAQFQNLSNPGPVWTLPCDVELNITFKFANVPFPVHPLDTNFGELNLKDDSGAPLCIGAFQPITTAASPDYDMILGMAFLRNAYVLIDLGDFVDGSSSKVGNPYIQLLPMTQPAVAHEDFVQTRLGGVDTTANFHLLPAMNATSPSSDDDDSSSSESWWDKYKWYVIGGAAGLAVLLGVLGACVCGARRRKAAAYRQLHYPAPGGLEQGRQEPMFARYDPGAGFVQGRGSTGAYGAAATASSGGYVPPGSGYAPPEYSAPSGPPPSQSQAQRRY